MCCLAGWGLRPGERRPDARTAGQRQARRAQLLRPLLRPRLSPHKMGQSGKASQRKGHGDRPSWSKEPALRPPGEGTGPERPEVDRLGVSNTPGSPGPWAGTALIMMKVYIFHKKSCGGGTSEQAGSAAQWWRPDQGLSLYVPCHPQYGSLPSRPQNGCSRSSHHIPPGQTAAQDEPAMSSSCFSLFQEQAKVPHNPPLEPLSHLTGYSWVTREGHRTAIDWLRPRVSKSGPKSACVNKDLLVRSHTSFF
ncbi:uncharacterized protein LOC109277761 isoform X1 [Panthera pardus]|uniref:Uncharacterized protein LOC109277761 isoform X1 n=1 Tax=Panthera pardus TaxID=9691 RepID=A0A9W2VH08_PANPR|nr:uncharacterized protein LOC109277761 isoform X1 [Panthera pardus]